MVKNNQQARTDRLVADWHAYNQRIQNDLAHAQQMAREKAETLLQLRRHYSAQEVAGLLGITRQAVYDGLRDAGELDPESDTQPFQDEEIRRALKEYHHALQAAQETVKPFAVDDVLLTPGRREAMGDVLDQLYEAEDNYDAALERAGRPAPHRMRPRRFLIQHLDVNDGTNGANWTAYRQTLEGARAAADAVYDPKNIALRQEIQDSKTGGWWFRGGGTSEWAGPTRARQTDG
jgi:predicted DNA-binding protein YlxM (UPF0122 family)